MKTRIKTIHEEQYTDNTKIIGVLNNYSLENDYEKESLIYIFNIKDKRYIFFNTVIDIIDYLLYSEKQMKRAYLKEDEFDKYYDSEIEGFFSKKLEWVN